MITFFRRFFSSRLGLVLSFLFLALIAVAFAASDVSNLGFTGQGQLSGDTVAKVGDRAITEAEVTRQMQNQLAARRQQDPTLDMNRFIADGGFEAVLDQLIDVRALELFAERAGLAAGKRLVDGEIASIPAFFGPTGQFDRNAFLAQISGRGLSEQQVRADVRAGLLARQVEVPAYGAARFPTGLALPYASLALEARTGLSAAIPASAMPPGPPPSPQELNAFYTRNIARYTIPERRVVRYAMFGTDELAAKSQPTEAEVAAFYKQNAARYAAGETRTLTQVIFQDQNAARAFEARVRGGATFAAAAAQAQLEPSTLADQTRGAYSGVASPAVAEAVFRAAEGAILPPQRSPLGWHVVRVDRITRTPARTLDQVRGEIVPQLAQQKLRAALADLSARIEDAIAEGATFDEIVAANQLKPVTTPAVTAAGIDPDNPVARVDPAFARFLEPMFQAEPDDDPVVETIVPDQRYALADLERVIPATPRPLAAVRPQVTQQLLADRAFRQAGDIARTITAKVGRGVPLAQAVREAGVPLPAPRPIGGRRQELRAAGGELGPDVRRMFEMVENSAKRVEAPNRAGWFVVYLDTITPGNARTVPGLVERLQSEIGTLIGREYSQQLANAAKAEIGVVRDPAVEAAVKRRLQGLGGQ